MEIAMDTTSDNSILHMGSRNLVCQRGLKIVSNLQVKQLVDDTLSSTMSSTDEVAFEANASALDSENITGPILISEDRPPSEKRRKILEARKKWALSEKANGGAYNHFKERREFRPQYSFDDEDVESESTAPKRHEAVALAPAVEHVIVPPGPCSGSQGRFGQGCSTPQRINNTFAPLRQLEISAVAAPTDNNCEPSGDTFLIQSPVYENATNSSSNKECVKHDLPGPSRFDLSNSIGDDCNIKPSCGTFIIRTTNNECSAAASSKESVKHDLRNNSKLKANQSKLLDDMSIEIDSPASVLLANRPSKRNCEPITPRNMRLANLGGGQIGDETIAMSEVSQIASTMDIGSSMVDPVTDSRVSPVGPSVPSRPLKSKYGAVAPTNPAGVQPGPNHLDCSDSPGGDSNSEHSSETFCIPTTVYESTVNSSSSNESVKQDMPNNQKNQSKSLRSMLDDMSIEIDSPGSVVFANLPSHRNCNPNTPQNMRLNNLEGGQDTEETIAMSEVSQIASTMDVDNSMVDPVTDTRVSPIGPSTPTRPLIHKYPRCIASSKSTGGQPGPSSLHRSYSPVDHNNDEPPGDTFCIPTTVYESTANTSSSNESLKHNVRNNRKLKANHSKFSLDDMSTDSPGSVLFANRPSKRNRDPNTPQNMRLDNLGGGRATEEGIAIPEVSQGTFTMDFDNTMVDPVTPPPITPLDQTTPSRSLKHEYTMRGRIASAEPVGGQPGPSNVLLSDSVCSRSSPQAEFRSSNFRIVTSNDSMDATSNETVIDDTRIRITHALPSSTKVEYVLKPVKIIKPEDPPHDGLRRSKRVRLPPTRRHLGEMPRYVASPSGNRHLVGVTKVRVARAEWADPARKIDDDCWKRNQKRKLNELKRRNRIRFDSHELDE